jgi:hypothetical protein
VTITDNQIRKIWAVARENNFEEDFVRHIAEQVSGRPSISGLTKDEAIKVIDRLTGKQIKGNQQAPRPANMATTKQLWKVRQLIKDLGWDDNPKRLEAYLLKYTGVAKLEWLTKQKAIGLIDGLKAILERPKQPKAQ